MLIARYAKIVTSLVLASFCLLVAFDNITDYGTNYLFVQHGMSRHGFRTYKLDESLRQTNHLQP
jgi:predicted small integral membrane protein